MEDCENTSMINNTGSITEEGPHLSDCDDTFPLTEHVQNNKGLNFEQQDKKSSIPSYKTVTGKYSENVSSPASPEEHNHYAIQCSPLLNSGKNVSTDSISQEDTNQNKLAEPSIISKIPSIDAGNTLAQSIYIDIESNQLKKQDECTKDRPKRMTMAQQATLEALASFDGHALSSLPVRKIDLRFELETEKQKRKRELELANEAREQQPLYKRPRTRLQAAQQEAEMSFKDISLVDGKKKYSTVQRLKARQPPSNCHPKNKSTQLTRVERAKKEVLESFDGAGLDSLSTKESSYHINMKTERAINQPIKPLTKVEKACLEALHAFGGEGLQGVMTGAKKRVARTLEKKVTKSPEKDKENEGCPSQSN